mmetsp:Transcript_17806/g.50679  ORF Transcript_17806/g.50679 Transcript_17806/m.50679 type:complete len:144 (-) Transcript_17806:74-505(-)
MHISSQIARRVAQIITLESAAERSEAAGLPKAAQLFINVQEGCVMELPLSGTSGSLSCSEHVRRFFDLENLVTPTKLHPVQLYWQLVYILDKMRAWTSLLDRVASKEETMEATILVASVVELHPVQFPFTFWTRCAPGQTCLM